MANIVKMLFSLSFLVQGLLENFTIQFYVSICLNLKKLLLEACQVIMLKICLCVLRCLVAQLCLTLCDPMDYSPPDSSAHGISREEYWSGVPFPTPRDLPGPGIEPESLGSPTLAGRFFTTRTMWEAPTLKYGDFY